MRRKNNWGWFRKLHNEEAAHFDCMSVAFRGLCGTEVLLLRFNEFCLQTFGRSSCVRSLPFASTLHIQDNADTKVTHTHFHIPGVVWAFSHSFRAVEECTWLKLRSHSDRSRNLYLDQLWPYYMVRWVGHVACAGEMKGTCRVGIMKGRDHFGDVDFGGSLIQRGTNVGCGQMCQDTVKWRAFVKRAAKDNVTKKGLP